MSCPSSQPQSDGLATATRSEKGAAGQFRGCAGIAEPTAVHAGLSQHPQRGGLLYTRGIADGDSALRRLWRHWELGRFRLRYNRYNLRGPPKYMWLKSFLRRSTRPHAHLFSKVLTAFAHFLVILVTTWFKNKNKKPTGHTIHILLTEYVNIKGQKCVAQ